MPSDHLLPSRSLRARVHRLIKRYGLIGYDDRVLVGVSGGADSTALLLLLAALRKPLKFELEAAHFDHRLRGRRAAANEERLIRELAGQLGIPLHAGAGDVKARSKTKRESLEEAARELRYRFLADTAAEAQCNVVAVGHTIDDQAETVLLHIVRGSGLRGLGGMTPKAEWPVAARKPPRLIRPLLHLSRADTAACCEAAGLAVVEDPSNFSAKHTRSRIRHELLPLLRDFNPRIEEALDRLARSASRDVQALEELAASALSRSSRKGEARVIRKRLSDLPRSLQHHAVRLAYQRVLGDGQNLGERHVSTVVGANAGGSGARLNLPRNVRVRIERASIVLTTDEEPSDTLPRRSVALPVPGSVRFGSWSVETEELQRKPRALSDRKGLMAVLDADACEGLKLRRRRDGDRFQPLGMAQEKKLQDFFVDAGVPREQRDALPLVDSKRGIAWIVSQRPAEWAKVTKNTKRCLRISAQRLT